MFLITLDCYLILKEQSREKPFSTTQSKVLKFIKLTQKTHIVITFWGKVHMEINMYDNGYLHV